ncbi:hypothetical protein [Streptomyces cucumeris]|uniref:hypothetical protein n=1 Tax=Streptomyces cucumeris TaxID=2962890 RepID=UPI003D727B8F
MATEVNSNVKPVANSASLRMSIRSMASWQLRENRAVITADGMPLVRPYVVEWERERDEHDRRRLQRERRRAAALATLRQDYVPVPWEVAA